MKIIAVTKCPVGVAHTYIAAEKIEKTCKERGFDVKVETQGSQGVENYLTKEDITNADYVIIAADVAIAEKDRFNGKKVLEVPIKEAIKKTNDLLDSLENRSILQGGEQKVYTNESISPMKSLMNGVSHMIPFVVVGGLFIALSLAIGGKPTDTGLVIPDGSIFNKVLAIGAIGFTLMIPILSGYIAFSISGRAALAPAMICAMVANDKDILSTSAGTGFIGAIITGFLVGYIVKYMNKWPIPKSLRAVMPIFVIPILTVTIVSTLFIMFLGQPTAMLMTGFENLLTSLSKNPSTSLLLGALLGAMIATDMGGPINKVAFLFGLSSITAGNPIIMGSVACAIAVPPLSVGISTLVSKKYYEEDEQAAGISAILMGLIGITEGAIPFAAADPKRVMPSIIIGSAVSGAISMFFGITDNVPHGGPIVALLGAVNKIGLFFLCLAIGISVSVILLHLLKKSKK